PEAVQENRSRRAAFDRRAALSRRDHSRRHLRTCGLSTSGRRLGASIVLVANNGGSQELIPLRQSLPPTPGQPASLRPTCQVGRPVGPQGCTVPGQTGPDGTPLTCLPPDQAASSPPDRKSTRLNSSHVAISYA